MRTVLYKVALRIMRFKIDEGGEKLKTISMLKLQQIFKILHCTQFILALAISIVSPTFLALKRLAKVD